jgi:hypothetical protein
MTKEEISARIATSTEKYKARREKQAKEKATRKAVKAAAHLKRQTQNQRVRKGLDWAKDKTITFGSGKFGNFVVTFGYQTIRQEANHSLIAAAFAIKAPHDKESEITGKGLVTSRLMDGVSNKLFTFSVPNYIVSIENAVNDVVSSELKIRLLTNHHSVPERLIKDIFGEDQKTYKKSLTNTK